MEFYTSAFFFISVLIAAIPAAILGVCQKPIRKYGLVVSVVFLFLLYCNNAFAFASFLLFIAVSFFGTFLVLKSWQSDERSMAKYRCALMLTIAPLALYKISTAVGFSMLGFIGISYLTFKSVSVVIEIRDGLITEMSWSDWAYYILFFPVVTSGPIDRYRRFLEDAKKIPSRSEYIDLLSRGLLLLLIGAVYQLVFATILLPHFQPQAFEASRSLVHNLKSAYTCAWFYALYLFFDFAGYSMMAMGIGYVFGIKVPRNFRAPFASLDIKDFWNRWHITLSFWLRDFVFMRFSLFATKKKLFKSRLTTAMIGYMINMTLMGAWHGLTVSYLCYGIYHGVLLALTDAYQKKSKFYKRHKDALWFKVVSWAITVNLIVIGLAIFSGQIGTIVRGSLSAG